MTFKILSKNNIGIATLLLLAVLLSQARAFNFLFDNALGRTLLILLLILISYTNKILGVVSVLLIIVMFNNSGIGYMEGFTDTTTPSTSSPITPTKTPTTTPIVPVFSSPVSSSPDLPATVPPTPSSSPEIPYSGEEDKSKEEKENTTETAAEGFDVLGTERTLQKGKNANSISVNSNVRNSDSIHAFEGSSSTFSKLFTPF